MSSIILSILLLQALSSYVDSVSVNHQHCGYTPKHPPKGYVTAPDEYSWTARLVYGNNDSLSECAGSVISPWYVLTAAHCVTEIKVKDGLTVRLVDFKRKAICDFDSPDCQNHQDFGISKITSHPDYSPYNNDIALIRLNQSITFTDKLIPICLPFEYPEPTENTTLTSSGWSNSLVAFRRKRTRTVLLLTEKSCMEDYQNTFCAANAKGEGPCQGDKGRPLMYEYKPGRMILEGIASFSSGLCNRRHYVSYFIRVRSFQNWIQSTMQMN